MNEFKNENTNENLNVNDTNKVEEPIEQNEHKPHNEIPNRSDRYPRGSKDSIRFFKTLHTIFHIAELAGFEVQGRILLKDKKTGKVWR